MEEEYFTFEDLKQLVLEHSGNDNPGIFIEHIWGYSQDFIIYIDDDGDIIIKI